MKNIVTALGAIAIVLAVSAPADAMKHMQMKGGQDCPMSGGMMKEGCCNMGAMMEEGMNIKLDAIRLIKDVATDPAHKKRAEELEARFEAHMKKHKEMHEKMHQNMGKKTGMKKDCPMDAKTNIQ